MQEISIKLTIKEHVNLYHFLLIKTKRPTNTKTQNAS